MDYKSKYLKYKQKYLDLKNAQTGGANTTLRCEIWVTNDVRKQLKKPLEKTVGYNDLWWVTVENIHGGMKVRKIIEIVRKQLGDFIDVDLSGHTLEILQGKLRLGLDLTFEKFVFSQNLILLISKKK